MIRGSIRFAVFQLFSTLSAGCSTANRAFVRVNITEIITSAIDLVLITPVLVMPWNNAANLMAVRSIFVDIKEITRTHIIGTAGNFIKIFGTKALDD